MPVYFIHLSSSIANHVTDNARFSTHDKQDLIRNAVKTAPMNSASELIKNVQDSPTKKIDSKLK